MENFSVEKTGLTMIIRRTFNMKKKLSLIILPLFLLLSSCSNINLNNNLFKEDTLAHSEIFGDINTYYQKLGNNKRHLLNLDSDFVNVGYQSQYDENNDKLSIRYVAAIKDANVKAIWHRGLAKGDGTETKAFNSGIFESKKIYKSLKNGEEIITAGEGEYLNYEGFIVYTLTNIPYSTNKDSYLAAYLTLTDLDDETNKIETDVFAIKVEKNNSNNSVNTFSFDNATDGYFLYGSFNGQNSFKYEDSATIGNNNIASYSNLELDEDDNFGSFYFDGSSFKYFNYETYFDHSFGFFDEDSLDGYVSPKLGGKYTLYVSSGGGTLNHIYTSASYFDLDITLYFKPGKWVKDGARFAICAFNNATNITPIWRNLTKDAKEGVYKIANYDTKTYPEFVFCRMDGSNPENSWDNKWNQTNDLSCSLLTGTKCCISIDNTDPWPNKETPYYELYDEVVGSTIIDNSGFSNINDNSTFEIHTAMQKAFLAYDGDFTAIPDSINPDGTKDISASNPINLTWDYQAPNNKTVSKYSVIYGQEADLHDGFRVDGNSNKSISFYNPYIGKNYYKLVATFTDGTTEETPIRTFNVDTTYPRNLYIDHFPNCRDLGGRVLIDGGKIKQGLIFRTAGNNYDTKGATASSQGKAEMLNHLKIKTEINLGESSTYELKLTNTYVATSCQMDNSNAGGVHHFSRNTEAVNNFFNILGDKNNYPVFFHCRIGTDRTGLCALLLNGLLGVSLDDIYQDYLFSNFAPIDGRRTIGDPSSSHNIMPYVNDILAMPGTNFKDKVYNTLLSLGISKETLNSIISYLTEGTLASDYQGRQIGSTAESFNASNNISLIHDTSERNHPDYYCTLNSTSSYVSYTFNVTESYIGKVYVYMGNNNYSSSNSPNKLISDAISAEFDGVSHNVPNLTYTEARMGKCNSRVNYYPVPLGSINLSPGTHTFKIIGNSGTYYSMNIAGIYIFVSD